jgi:hypothetical protein
MLAVLLCTPVAGSLFILVGHSGITKGSLVFQGLIFGMLGVCYAVYWPRWFSFFQVKERPVLSREGWRFMILLLVEMLVILCALYVLTDRGSLLLAVLEVCLFLLPLLLLQSWQAWLSIPAEQYKVWFNPPGGPDPVFLYWPRNYPIHFRLTSHYHEQADALFPMTAPAKVRLGKLFFHFLLEEHQSGRTGIDTVGQDGQPYGWAFYVRERGRWGVRRLDPELNLEENKIRRQGIIQVIRIKKEETL